MTLDVAEMDLGNVFELGMGYVPLSRVRSLNGLKLVNLNGLALKVHPKILQCDKIFRDDSDILIKHLRTLPEKEMEQYQRKTLMGRFGDCVREKSKCERKERN